MFWQDVSVLSRLCSGLGAEEVEWDGNSGALPHSVTLVRQYFPVWQAKLILHRHSAPTIDKYKKKKFRMNWLCVFKRFVVPQNETSFWQNVPTALQYFWFNAKAGVCLQGRTINQNIIKIRIQPWVIFWCVTTSWIKHRTDPQIIFCRNKGNITLSFCLCFLLKLVQNWPFPKIPE